MERKQAAFLPDRSIKQPGCSYKVPEWEVGKSGLLLGAIKLYALFYKAGKSKANIFATLRL